MANTGWARTYSAAAAAATAAAAAAAAAANKKNEKSNAVATRASAWEAGTTMKILSRGTILFTP